jgi:dolichyl-phosphate-mannose--protein O-mannosyl transferase
MLLNDGLFMYQGQPFSGPEHRVYLLGNPVIWWSCLGAIVSFVLASVVVAFSNKCKSCSSKPRVHSEVQGNIIPLCKFRAFVV